MLLFKYHGTNTHTAAWFTYVYVLLHKQNFMIHSLNEKFMNWSIPRNIWCIRFLDVQNKSLPLLRSTKYFVDFSSYAAEAFSAFFSLFPDEILAGYVSVECRSKALLAIFSLCIITAIWPWLKSSLKYIKSCEMKIRSCAKDASDVRLGGGFGQVVRHLQQTSHKSPYLWQ